MGYCVGARLWERFKRVFQFAMIFALLLGAATASLIINLSRQGLIFIPALFIMKAIIGLTGLVWTQPVADLISIVLAAILYVRSYRRLSGQAGPELTGAGAA